VAAYATIQDALERYGEDYVIVSCDRNGNGELDDEAFALALEDASDWIDSYLAGRITLPLDPTTIPRRLVKVCIDVAIYELCEGAPTMTTQKKERYESAKEFMIAVRNGERRLTLDQETVQSPNATQEAQTVIQQAQKCERITGSRLYTRDTLRKL
jgi:phage gp36-like protein